MPIKGAERLHDLSPFPEAGTPTKRCREFVVREEAQNQQCLHTGKGGNVEAGEAARYWRRLQPPYLH